jgi:hypothetical protein
MVVGRGHGLVLAAEWGVQIRSRSCYGAPASAPDLQSVRHPGEESTMRAEIANLVPEIEQALTLLRRRL